MNLEPDPMKIRMRPDGGGYENEMMEAVYIEEADDVLAYLYCFQPHQNAARSELAQHYYGVDARNGWHSWRITLRGAPVLWTDKQVPGIGLLDPAPETAST